MNIHAYRRVIYTHSERLQNELLKRAEINGTSVKDEAIKDPFLSGRVYELAQIVSELRTLEEDELEARDRARR